jgi:hypothetical protein
MARAERSGRRVRAADVPLILAMIARGDRRHDIAAWFGLNQGRIAEVEEGQHGSPPLAHGVTLPPSGSPGPKALTMRSELDRVIMALQSGDVATATRLVREAIAHFDKDE